MSKSSTPVPSSIWSVDLLSQKFQGIARAALNKILCNEKIDGGKSRGIDQFRGVNLWSSMQIFCEIAFYRLYAKCFCFPGFIHVASESGEGK